METGTIENNRRRGRSPKWTKRDNNHLPVLVKKNKKTAARTILRLFNENKADTVCLDTTRVELRVLGMFRRCINKSELIYFRNHTKRIKFAKTYKKWTKIGKEGTTQSELSLLKLTKNEQKLEKK